MMDSDSDIEVVWSNQTSDEAQLTARIQALTTGLLYRKRDAPVTNAPVTGDPAAAAELRSALIKRAQIVMASEMDEANFARDYPNHSATAPSGTQRAGYLGRLRAVEDTCNGVNRGWNLPPIYVVDWTSLPHGDQDLSSLQYMQKIVVHPEAKRLLQTLPIPEVRMSCDPSCTNCRAPEGVADRRYCCSNVGRLVERNGRIRMSDHMAPKDRLHVRLECTDDCACSPTTCSNRAVQLGRQKPLLIFRHVEKGWSLYALEEYAVGEYICDYSGRLQTETSSGPAAAYDFNLGQKVAREEGKPRPLVIASYTMGNEGRFAAHSCSPSAYPESTFINDGHTPLAANQISFRAARPISPGQEITIDYFDGRSLEDDDDFETYFPECRCGAPDCRFTAQKVAAHKRKTLKSPSRNGKRATKTLKRQHSPC